MNGLTLLNTSLQVVGTAAVAAGIVEILKGNTVPGLIAAGIGLVAYVVYEKLPPSTPV